MNPPSLLEGSCAPSELSPTAALAHWRAVAPQEIDPKSISTGADLQPRVEGLAPSYHWHRLAAQADEHVTCMRGRLAANATAQLDPVLVAMIDGEAFLVDGHHRLRAYSLEKRPTVPARVLNVTRRTAQLVSKLVNLDGAKLPMHSEQRKDAAWQYIAGITLRGRLPLPQSDSQRIIAARFGVSRDTVQRMLARMPEVDPKEFSRESCDPGMGGWPRWKYVRESRTKGMHDKLTPDAAELRKIEGFLKGLSKLIERYGPDAAVKAMRYRAAEPEGEHAEEVRQMLEEIDGPADY